MPPKRLKLPKGWQELIGTKIFMVFLASFFCVIVAVALSNGAVAMSGLC